LPAWRPGRYELANYAKNVLRLDACTAEGQPLAIRKLSKDRWLVHPQGAGTVKVRYSYYAHQMDAGNSWVDASCVYINFINCLLYAEDRLEEPCRCIATAAGYRVACGLPQPRPGQLEAEDYYRLVDSPLVASPDLHHRAYEVDGHWFPRVGAGHRALRLGAAAGRLPRVYPRTDATDGRLPLPGLPLPAARPARQALPRRGTLELHCDDPRPGRKNWRRTVPRTGRASLARTLPRLERDPHPAAELLPYDFSRENYFPTGYVAEGLTTYYGDLFLARSGFFSRRRTWPN
jgi:hypothetical protein